MDKLNNQGEPIDCNEIPYARETDKFAREDDMSLGRVTLRSLGPNTWNHEIRRRFKDYSIAELAEVIVVRGYDIAVESVSEKELEARNLTLMARRAEVEL